MRRLVALFAAALASSPLVAATEHPHVSVGLRLADAVLGKAQFEDADFMQPLGDADKKAYADLHAAFNTFNPRTQIEEHST